MRQQHRRDLIAGRLAEARRQHDQGVATFHGLCDRGLLFGTQTRDAERARSLLDVGRRHEGPRLFERGGLYRTLLARPATATASTTRAAASRSVRVVRAGLVLRAAASRVLPISRAGLVLRTLASGVLSVLRTRLGLGAHALSLPAAATPSTPAAAAAPTTTTAFVRCARMRVVSLLGTTRLGCFLSH